MKIKKYQWYKRKHLFFQCF